MRRPMLALGLFAFVSAEEERAFRLPPGFEGSWRGVPQFTAMGPFSQALHWAISRAGNGDYLMQDTVQYDGDAASWQRFYVESQGPTPGRLNYCGVLQHFDDMAEAAGSMGLELFQATPRPAEDDGSVTFCLATEVPGALDYKPYPAGCAGCGCANLTMSLGPDDVLRIRYDVAGTEGHAHARHLWVDFERTGAAPEIDVEMPDVASCDFSSGGRDATPVSALDASLRQASPGAQPSCPFWRSETPASSEERPPASPRASAARASASLRGAATETWDHCYRINEATGSRFEWTVADDVLTLAYTARLEESTDFLAVGFRPMSRSYAPGLAALDTGRTLSFGMIGADIVAASPEYGVKTMYAALYTGPPEDSADLDIFDESVEYDGEHATLRFSRRAAGTGHLAAQGVPEKRTSILSDSADVLWATGKTSAGDDAGFELAYHDHHRGMRPVKWLNPEVAMFPWRCEPAKQDILSSAA